jgi:hypothetical protein
LIFSLLKNFKVDNEMYKLHFSILNKIVNHKYSDGAEKLAEKVLTAFNKQTK